MSTVMKMRRKPKVESLEERVLLSAGDLDPSFGVGGIVTTAMSKADQAETVLAQPDGKIVAVGDRNMVRYNAGGSLDTTFGNTGKVSLSGSSGAALYPPGTANAGKIVVVGSVSGKKTGGDFFVTRYLANGAIDTSFGNRGKVTTDFAGRYDGADRAVVQPDGKVVVAGFYNDATRRGIALARYNANGSLDTTFGTGGKLLTPYLKHGGTYRPVSVALQPDGKIAVATTTVEDGGGDFVFTVVRYTANGALDSSFGPDGRGFNQVIDLLADHPGVVPIGGFRDSLAYEAVDVAVQADGKIVAVGTTYGNLLGDGWLVARFDTAGNLDNSYGVRGTTFVKPTADPNQWDQTTGVALQADGKAVVVGAHDGVSGFLVGRFDTSGNLDPTFGNGGLVRTNNGTLSQSLDVAIQPDGKIVAAGSPLIASSSGFGLARYLASDTTTMTAALGHASAPTTTTVTIVAPPADPPTISNPTPTPTRHVLSSLPARRRFGSMPNPSLVGWPARLR